MKYKVLVNGRFGEGWKAGDIVAMDDEAARVPLEEGAIEPYDESVTTNTKVSSSVTKGSGVKSKAKSPKV